MGRLLGLQGRCTPLVLGADAGAKLLPVSELGDSGALKLGRRKLELPPQPLGRDTTQAPFLAVSNEIAVIDGAASHHPRKLVEMLAVARKEAGWQRLLYAPAVEPAEMPLLAYLGVDLFDSLTAELRSVAGFRLEQGDWIPDGKATAAGNLKALAIWLARIRTALEQGLLRELVERTALHNPRVTQLLHHTRDQRGASRNWNPRRRAFVRPSCCSRMAGQARTLCATGGGDGAAAAALLSAQAIPLEQLASPLPPHAALAKQLAGTTRGFGDEPAGASSTRAGNAPPSSTL